MTKFGRSILRPLALAGSVLAQVKVPPGWEVGVKWQIEIQKSLDVNSPLQPADALVWDIDLYSIARNPEIVDYVRVCILEPSALTHPVL